MIKESSAIKVFISYAHLDEEYRQKLNKPLRTLEREGLISSIWHDRKIKGGNRWQNDIDTNLETAHLILLLVSWDFLASDYIHDIELKRALEREEAGEARVIPIIIRPCDWEAAPFCKLQCLPTGGKAIANWGNEDEALTDIAKSLRSIIEEIVFPYSPEKPDGSSAGKSNPILLTKLLRDYSEMLIKQTMFLGRTGTNYETSSTTPTTQVKADSSRPSR